MRSIQIKYDSLRNLVQQDEKDLYSSSSLNSEHQTLNHCGHDFQFSHQLLQMTRDNTSTPRNIAGHTRTHSKSSRAESITFTPENVPNVGEIRQVASTLRTSVSEESPPSVSRVSSHPFRILSVESNPINKIVPSSPSGPISRIIFHRDEYNNVLSYVPRSRSSLKMRPIPSYHRRSRSFKADTENLPPEIFLPEL